MDLFRTYFSLFFLTFAFCNILLSARPEHRNTDPGSFSPTRPASAGGKECKVWHRELRRYHGRNSGGRIYSIEVGVGTFNTRTQTWEECYDIAYRWSRTAGFVVRNKSFDIGRLKSSRRPICERKGGCVESVYPFFRWKFNDALLWAPFGRDSEGWVNYYSLEFDGERRKGVRVLDASGNNLLKN